MGLIRRYAPDGKNIVVEVVVVVLFIVSFSYFSPKYVPRKYF